MRLYMERELKTRPGHFKGEWLGEGTHEDIVSEAWALLNDPRDTICRVKVYNDRGQYWEPLTFARGWSADGTKRECDGTSKWR